MKFSFTLIALLMCAAAFAQRFLERSESSFQYSFTAPQGSMHRNIERGHGIAISFLKSIRKTPLFIGLEINASQYGSSRTRQTYTFDDGTAADMDIIVGNDFTNAMFSARYYPLSTANVQPYFSGKFGYSLFSTSLSIYDPNDRDHCAPVENDLLQHDGTFVSSLGAGVLTDLSSVFRTLNKNMLLFEIGVNYTRGGRVQYMNANKPDGPMHTQPSDVTADFINTQTKIIHAHHVGYLFSSTLEMIEIRAGLVYRFGF